MSLNETIKAVTEQIQQRSRESRGRYLEKTEQARQAGPRRG